MGQRAKRLGARRIVFGSNTHRAEYGGRKIGALPTREQRRHSICDGFRTLASQSLLRDKGRNNPYNKPKQCSADYRAKWKAEGHQHHHEMNNSSLCLFAPTLNGQLGQSPKWSTCVLISHHRRLPSHYRGLAGCLTHAHQNGLRSHRDGSVVTRKGVGTLRCHRDPGAQFTSIRCGERLAEIGAVRSIRTTNSPHRDQGDPQVAVRGWPSPTPRFAVGGPSRITLRSFRMEPTLGAAATPTLTRAVAVFTRIRRCFSSMAPECCRSCIRSNRLVLPNCASSSTGPMPASSSGPMLVGTTHKGKPHPVRRGHRGPGEASVVAFDRPGRPGRSAGVWAAIWKTDLLTLARQLSIPGPWEAHPARPHGQSGDTQSD